MGHVKWGRNNQKIVMCTNSAMCAGSLFTGSKEDLRMCVMCTNSAMCAGSLFTGSKEDLRTKKCDWLLPELPRSCSEGVWFRGESTNRTEI